MILIGSRALMFRAPEVLNRQPKDWDFMCQEYEGRDFLKKYKSDLGTTKIYRLGDKLIAEGITPCEFELYNPFGSSNEFYNLVCDDKDTLETEFGLVPSLDLLFTLKASHRFLKNSPHFWKTALDYHKMKLMGCKIRPEYQEFYKLRTKETYTYNHPKLNVKKDDFFKGDDIAYQYDHDSIHLVMSRGTAPAYTFFKKEGAEVACDKEKFFALTEEQRLNSVIEETCVLALERSQIPHGDKVTPKWSYMFALSKVCSSITSGWWREWAYDHIFNAVKAYPADYVEKFWTGVANGTVKPYGSQNTTKL